MRRFYRRSATLLRRTSPRPRRRRGRRERVRPPAARRPSGVRAPARHEDVVPLGAVRPAGLRERVQEGGRCRPVVNAQVSAQKQLTQAEQCITDGAKVGIITRLDSGTVDRHPEESALVGRQVDRLRPPDRSAAWALYVVVQQHDRRGAAGTRRHPRPEGERQLRREAVVAQLWGGPEDANTFSSRAARTTSEPALQDEEAHEGAPASSFPAGTSDKAQTIFQPMLIRTSNKIDGVAAANDGLANARRRDAEGAQLDPIPLCGQDATTEGAQNIISGWQTIDRLEVRARARRTQPRRPRSSPPRVRSRRRRDCEDKGRGLEPAPDLPQLITRPTGGSSSRAASSRGARSATATTGSTASTSRASRGGAPRAPPRFSGRRTRHREPTTPLLELRGVSKRSAPCRR